MRVFRVLRWGPRHHLPPSVGAAEDPQLAIGQGRVGLVSSDPGAMRTGQQAWQGQIRWSALCSLAGHGSHHRILHIAVEVTVRLSMLEFRLKAETKRLERDCRSKVDAKILCEEEKASVPWVVALGGQRGAAGLCPDALASLTHSPGQDLS